MRCPLRTVALASGVAFGAAVALIACSSPDSSGARQPIKLSVTVAPPIEALDGTAYETANRVKLTKTPPQELPGLHNVYRLSPTVVSGSEPHGEEAFRELQKMGIKTVLSVDGKVPDEKLAAKYGMAYVHVPIQYKGIADDEVMKIAKTFREKEGPFFVHCFHGKHRGPASAAIGRIVVDGVSREQAIAEMRQWCGTSPTYEGLYRTIAKGPIPTEKATRAMAFDFPAAHPFGGFREAMIVISRADDHLKFLAKRKWEADPEHPDVDALNEASKLADAAAECAKMEDTAARPPDFQKWMAETAAESVSLRDAFRAWKDKKGTLEAADQAYKRMSAACTACHDVYRN